MPHRRFDRSRLHLRPLGERKHLITLSQFATLEQPITRMEDRRFAEIAARIVRAREAGAAVILMMGAHLLRAGTSRYIIDLMKRGLLTHIGMNGAGAIHDYEMALVGATTESVSDYIAEGQFGLWQETGQINRIVKEGANAGLGFGEAVGKAIAVGNFPFKQISILAAGYELGVPVTVHVGIGYDIIHEHPDFDGAATGQASYEDFLIFVQSVCALENGVFLNFGSAVMGPEVYLKALSMARNVARQDGLSVRQFTTAVFDLFPLPTDLTEEPLRNDFRYYYRPLKTILVRTVRDGGTSYYLQGDHRQTLPTLYSHLKELSLGKSET
ncbi:MAG: hypothetical protein EHM61_25625 [Acidobacteria bacterium]|nr:MAG: hypothetical protein EHM61_25625 [Acidobacteriota bacterium]